LLLSPAATRIKIIIPHHGLACPNCLCVLDPKSPICALKLEDRTSLTGVSRGLSTGLRRTCSTSATAPLVRFGGVVKPGFFSRQSVYSSGLKKGPIVAGFTHFVMAAALPKSPVCALKLEDRTSLTGVSRGLSTGLKRACSTSATAPPVRFEEVVKPGRFSAQSKHERESHWAFQVFLSVKNRPRFSSKLESGPILLKLHSPVLEMPVL
jgi:hypothetical protein